MADDGSSQSTEVWPLPKFRFEVAWDDVVATFQEVSGLDTEAQPIEYRHASTPGFAAIKMPGLKKYGDITLKKGLFKGDSTFWDWFRQTSMITIARKTVTITLRTEDDAVAMVWTLTNAFPIKITGTDLKSTGNEVAIETIVLAHEGLSIAGR